MRKYLNYIIFGLVVLGVVGLAVNHSRTMRGLVSRMTTGDPEARKAAAADLITREQFMDSITGEEIPVRVQSAEALELLGTPAAVKQALPLLKDTDKSVRERTIQTLQKIGGTSLDHFKELIVGLKDGDANIRRGTITAITDAQNGIGPKPGFVAAIVDYMKKEGGARGPGGDVLGNAKFTKAGANTESVPLLMGLLDEKDEAIRVAGGESLGKVGDKAAVPRLITAMAKDTAQVRRVAIGAIALIADVSGEAALTEAITNTDDDDEARSQAAAGLGKIATPSAIKTLVTALNDDDLKLRSAASGALARAGRPELNGPTNGMVVAALNAALRDTRATVRLGAAQALQGVATTEANAPLIAVLTDTKNADSLRMASALALGFPGNAAGVSPLVQALSDKSGEVNSAARDALAAIGPAATAALIATLNAAPDVANLAAQALAKQGSEALPALTKIAQTPEAKGQKWAAVALGELGLAEAKPLLEMLAKSPDSETAFVAKEQLNRF